MRDRVIAAAALAALGACADLERLGAGVCGNGVVEAPDEDCDAPGSSTCNDACRLVCATDSECPTGSRCGGDGVCRFAAGRWHELGLPLREAPFDLGFSDVDGNGYLDIVGYDRQTFWTHLGQPGGGFEAGLRVPSPTGVGPTMQLSSPAFGDLDGDGFLDAAGGGPTGLTLAFGHQAVLGFTVTAQPSITVTTEQLTVLPLRTAAAPFHDLLEVTMPPGSGLLATIRRYGDREAPPPVTLVSTAQGPLMNVAVVDLDGDDRDEVVAFTSLDHARVFATAGAAPGAVTSLRADVAFAVPLASARLFAADVTGDGIRDLIVDPIGAGGPHVAAGDGAGGFAAAAAALSLDVGADLLALADLDADGDADLITATGIWRVDAGHAVRIAGTTTGWTDALVADFNHDARLDVAAFTTGSGVEVLMAAPGNLYNRNRLADQPACDDASGRQRGCARVGDFDGDQFTDLVFAGTVGRRLELRVMYGGPSGLSGVPVELAQLDGGPPELLATFNMEVANLVRGNDQLMGNDARNELIVQLPAPGSPLTGAIPHDLRFFLGNADRIASAAYQLAGRRALSAVGRFRPGGGPDGDILVRYEGGTFDLISGADDRRLGSEERRALPVAPGAVPASWCVDGGAVYGARVGDLDGDGHDELVGVPCDVAGPAAGAVEHVQLARIVGASPQLEITNVPMPATPRFSTIGEVQLVDLDDDGALDLVLGFDGAVAGENGLVVFWGEGGGFGARPSVLQLPVAIHAFAVVEANGLPRRELLLVTAADGPPTSTLVEVTGDRELVPRQAAGLPIVTGAGDLPRAADLDGDTIDDVVIAGADGLHVFLGCARHATCP